MADRKEIRICGFGGQGVVLAGIVLARAAVIFGDSYAVQTQSHGAESRGGACLSDVIISDQKVDFPACESPSVLVALSPEAAVKYVPTMQKDGVFIIDEDMVPDPPEGPYALLARFPATRIATEEIKNRLVANIIILGATLAISPVVSREALKEAVNASVPKGTTKINLQALNRGFQLGDKFMQTVNEQKKI
ncbi:2-oxoacid:acceptor oxidoreductase family protein [Chloroflexota bacterium]